MKSLFNFDNPFIQLLSRLGDLMIVNVLFWVCSLPVVTAGASLCGLVKVVQAITLGDEPVVTRTFFRAFRQNFRQATIVWLALVFIAACLAGDLMLANLYLTGWALTAARALVAIPALAVLAAACYLFPLLVRYENTLKEHCRNALLLAIGKLPRTVALAALNAAPFVLAWAAPVTFLKSLAVWLIVGFAGLSYLGCMLLRPVLAQLEGRSAKSARPDDEDEDEEDEGA